MTYPRFIDPRRLVPEPDEVLEKKVAALLAAMTEEELLDLCHGHPNPEGSQVANAGYHPGVPRLGVPEIRMYDGPAGVTSIYETTGLPVQEMLAAAWDRELAYRYGAVEGSENVAISGNTQLGSQFDVVRVPQFTRDKDMLGEDPFLVTALAVPETRGIQDQGAVATLKHFGAASIGTDMQAAADQLVSEQTLHELVFPPFEAAAKEGRAGAFMCCYNKFNGAYASANTYAQKTVLRDYWGFRGYMMSDWGANHALTTGKGMDMEMPSGSYNSNDRIRAAIAKGRLTWEDVLAAAGHVLYGMGLVGYLNLVSLDENGSVRVEEGRTEPIAIPDRYAQAVAEGLLNRNAETCLEVARKGAVLLKNENAALPLTPADYTGGASVALLGLGGVRLLSGAGQERSYGRISRMKSPLEELRRLAGPEADFRGEIGLEFFGQTIPADCLYQDETCTKPGLVRTYGIDGSNAEPSPFLAILGGSAAQADGTSEPTEAQPSMPAFTGGGGVEFHGVAVADEDDDEIPFVPPWTNALIADMPGHETGSVCQVDPVIDFTCGTLDGQVNQTYKNGPDGTAFPQGSVYTWDGYLRVPAEGDYALILQAIGGNTVFKIELEGKFVTLGSTELRESAQWPWGSLVCTPEGMEVHGGMVHLEAGKAYPIRLCGRASLAQKDLQLRLAWITPQLRSQRYAAALEAAAQADKVLFFLSDDYSYAPAGTPVTFTMAGLPSLDPPAPQLRFLEDVRAAMKPGSRLTLIHNNGQLFALGQAEPLADAIMNIWTPGQEGGQAVAELLLGQVNPSGKLALTIPARGCDTLVTDTPEHKTTRYLGYQRDGRTYVDFDEGILTGYRWYEAAGVKPLYAFGHGLSYAHFEYTDLLVLGNRVSFTVTNTGMVPGTEIAQVYLGPAQVPEGVQTAPKQLCGFIRLEDLRPGQARRVTISIPDRSLCYWNAAQEPVRRPDGTMDKWVRAPGPRQVFVGPASDKLPLVGLLEVPS